MGRMKRIAIACFILIAIGLVGYSGGYYYVTAEWPWQQNVSAAELVLRDVPVAAAPTSHAAPTVVNQPTHTAVPPRTSGPLSTAAPPQATAPVATPVGVQQGTLQEGTIHSAFMHGDMPFLIYLPPGYNDPAQVQRRYPVAYLLHGSPGNYRDWTAGAGVSATAAALIATGRIPPMILVMPEGRGSLTNDSEWVDSDVTGLRAESYMVGEVLPFIDAQYRTVADRADRAIGGLSSGGYGAVNIALHHPDVFSTAFGLSGSYGTPRSVLGRGLFTSAASKTCNTPISYVAHMANPQQLRVYLVVGKQDKLDGTLQSTQQMEQALNDTQVPHGVEYAEGAHSWHFWSIYIINALEYFAAQLPQQAR